MSRCSLVPYGREDFLTRRHCCNRAIIGPVPASVRPIAADMVSDGASVGERGSPHSRGASVSVRPATRCTQAAGPISPGVKGSSIKRRKRIRIALVPIPGSRCPQFYILRSVSMDETSGQQLAVLLHVAVGAITRAGPRA